MVSIRTIVAQMRAKSALSTSGPVFTVRDMPSHPPVARVVFDESHAESWTIRPSVAAEIQPSHPADSSYALAADALRQRSLAVEAHVDGPLDASALAGAAVLVIA